MILADAVKLYRVLQEVKNHPFDVRSAHGVVMLLHDLTPHVKFYAEQEEKIARKYSVDGVENGKFKISADQLEGYLSEKDELNHIEIDIVIPEIIYHTDKITPTQLEAFGDYIKVDDIEV